MADTGPDTDELLARAMNTVRMTSGGLGMTDNGSTETIGKLRRRFFTYGRAKVLCTYHPSYLMRNPAAKKDVWEDMKKVRAFLEK